MTHQFIVIGYIKRDDIDYGFLIPIYESNNQLYFHKLTSDTSKIENFTAYNKDLYEHENNFVPVKSDFIKKIGDSPTLAFKFFDRMVLGSPDEDAFVEFLKLCLTDSRFDNDFLRKELLRIIDNRRNAKVDSILERYRAQVSTIQRLKQLRKHMRLIAATGRKNIPTYGKFSIDNVTAKKGKLAATNSEADNNIFLVRQKSAG